MINTNLLMVINFKCELQNKVASINIIKRYITLEISYIIHTLTKV